MTRNRDISRLLGLWLADGPRQAADRVLLSALTEIDHTPQGGAHIVPWRYSDMPTPVRILLVAALMVASAGAALLAAGQLSPDNAPQPTPDRPQLGAGILIGSDPQGDWTAERQAVFGAAAGTYRLRVRAPADALIVESPEGRQILLGSVTLPSPGVVELGATDRCPSPGTYAFEVADDGNRLTIAIRTDTCADRQALFDGDWDRDVVDWIIKPGLRYRSDMPGVTVDVSVPTGFVTAAGGEPYLLSFANPTPYAKFQTDDLTFLLSAGDVMSDRCRESAGSRPPPTTLDAFLDWTRSSQGTAVSEPIPVTVAGHPGVRVEVSGTDACEAAHDGMSFWFTPRAGPMGSWHSRDWAIDLDGRLLLVSLFDDNVPFDALTPAMLATGDEFIASMEITPQP
ncbi:MAG: hypothetical protein L0227_12640 [Chloroflexi bacterium]|nr:hypothetical protein [Chloroflexota bacterium]